MNAEAWSFLEFNKNFGKPCEYMLLCDSFESTVDDFNRSECRKRQSNSYIAIR